jgi:hypothetical protein
MNYEYTYKLGKNIHSNLEITKYFVGLKFGNPP